MACFSSRIGVFRFSHSQLLLGLGPPFHRKTWGMVVIHEFHQVPSVLFEYIPEFGLDGPWPTLFIHELLNGFPAHLHLHSHLKDRLIHTTSTHTNTDTDIYDTHAKFRVRGICQTIRTMKRIPKRWLRSSDVLISNEISENPTCSSKVNRIWTLLPGGRLYSQIVQDGMRHGFTPALFSCQIANSTVLSLYRRLQR